MLGAFSSSAGIHLCKTLTDLAKRIEIELKSIEDITTTRHPCLTDLKSQLKYTLAAGSGAAILVASRRSQEDRQV